MSTKKNLTVLVSETPQPPLRRGRGLRLSRASKQAQEFTPMPSVSAVPSTLLEPSATVAQPPTEPVADSAVTAEIPIVPDTVAAEAEAVAAVPTESAAPPDPERDKRKLQLRKDLLKQSKRIARAQDRKLYQVIESALEEYIQRHGATE